MRKIWPILLLGWWLILPLSADDFSVEKIVEDIYYQLLETSEVNYEELLTDLQDLAENPININQATENDLLRLHFLSPAQVDDILLYVYHHPMVSLYELQLIPSLHDYDIRHLCAFVEAGEGKQDKPTARELFRYAKHEILTRVDARNVESYTGDPVYTQFKYKFNAQNKVQFGCYLTRPAGGRAKDLGYGGYIQLNQIGAFREIVAGNYQAQFGLGLVTSNPFHMGKNNYIQTAGLQAEGLSKYTSTNGNGLHGIGATVLFPLPDKYKLSFSSFYSLTRPKDTLLRHMVGGNLTFRYQRLKIGLTAVENIWSDSVSYYHNPRYTHNYFHGDKQAVMGLNFRYNQGKVDVFGEVATAQNTRWGVGLNLATRITPINDLNISILYRYYSPHFDNTLGYGFSETSRINDENGLYVGLEVKRLRYWRFAFYADGFYFDGIKYGIPWRPSWGYDTQFECNYIPSDQWNMGLRLRAREKGKESTYSARYQFNYAENQWRLRTQADANIFTDDEKNLSWGISIHQDVEYAFTNTPLTLQMRVQGFYAPQWDNRIYLHENDVLYGYSIPAIYGVGGRCYLNLRVKIIEQLSLYFRLSETIYEKHWAADKQKKMTDTDLHLLLRATL